MTVIIATQLHTRGTLKGQVTQTRVAFMDVAGCAAWFAGVCANSAKGALGYRVKEAEVEGLGRVTFAPSGDRLPAFQAFVPDGCDDPPVWFATAVEAFAHLAGKEEDRARALRRRMYAHSC